MGYRDSTGSPDGGPDAQQHDYHAARVDPGLTRPARGHRGPITTWAMTRDWRPEASYWPAAGRTVIMHIDI